MPRRMIMALGASMFAMTVSGVAHAYIGPGAGLSAIGTIVAVIGAIFLVFVGFVWYPIKRLTRKRTAKRGKIQQSEKADPS